MIITFKSFGYIFDKEMNGNKPNTVRMIDKKDERFDLLENYNVDKIQIINKEDLDKSFIRKITDITFFDNLVIISWEHKNE